MRGPIRVAVFFIAAAASAADPGTAAKQIESARRFIHDVKYAEAGKVVDDALARGGLERATLVELFELQGILQASLGAREKAIAAYQRLLSLEPSHVLPADLAPKVKAPFFEAKARLGTSLPLALEVTLAASVLSARIENDPLKLGRAVRFHLKTGEGAWETRDLPADAAQLTVPQVKLSYFAELLDAASDVLARTATLAQAPRATATAAAGPATAAPPGVRLEPEPRRSRSFALPITFLGGAAAAGVVGAIFGAMSAAGRSSWANATANMTVVTAYDGTSALQLSQQVQTDAIVANVLFSTAAALAVIAVVLFVFGG